MHGYVGAYYPRVPDHACRTSKSVVDRSILSVEEGHKTLHGIPQGLKDGTVAQLQELHKTEHFKPMTQQPQTLDHPGPS